MTRRDAALLSLTLAGLYCLFVAITLSYRLAATFSMPAPSVMTPGNRTLDRLFSVLPLMMLSCVGIALIQSRRKFSTMIFGANPSLDSTAQIDAGDIRLLIVRVLGLLFFAQLMRSFASVDALIILGIATALCFFGAGTVVRWLFAAGPGEGKSARYRDGLAFALGVIGAYYVVSSIGGAVEAIGQRLWLQAGAHLAVIVTGVVLFVCRRSLASRREVTS